MTDTESTSAAPGDAESDDVLRQQVPIAFAGRRLDQVLVKLFGDFSRSRLQKWLSDGGITVDGNARRPRDKVMGGEWVTVRLPESADEEWVAQDIPLDIVYEDDTLLVVNKPAGMVVHPAAGNRDGTLLNGLLHYAPELIQVPRAGIVHRLDKDTTGLLVVARTLKSHKNLVEQLKERTVRREYFALVSGVVVVGGTVAQPIGRHSIDRKKMAVRPTGREAITHYRVAQRFRSHTLLRVNLETGRTHQIRVHMAWLKHSITGDKAYGGRPRLPGGAEPGLIETLQQFPRQALHAHQLGLNHPETDEPVSWQAPVPDDMQTLIDLLQEDVTQHADD